MDNPMNGFTKIATHKVYKYGVRGAAVSIPKVFLIDNSLTPGDTIEFYRKTENEKDILLLMPQSKNIKGKIHG